MYHDHNYARIHIEGAFGNTEPSSSDSRLNKEVQVERNNEKIQENLPSEVKIEPCDFYKDFDTYVKEVIQKDGNQYENVVENNTRDLYRDHVIKEEMVIGPVVIKEEEDYEPVCRCKSNKINTTDYTKMEDWIDFQEENEPYEFNNDTNTNIIEETEN